MTRQKVIQLLEIAIEESNWLIVKEVIQLLIDMEFMDDNEDFREEW
jgi:hypothetical protein